MGPKKILVAKDFWSQNLLIQKKIMVQKNVGQKNFVQEKLLVKNNFCIQKELWVKKEFWDGHPSAKDGHPPSLAISHSIV